MLTWLSANLGTILVLAVLLAVVGMILRKMIRDKRQGKTSCGCGCEGCALHGQCHGGAKPAK